MGRRISQTRTGEGFLIQSGMEIFSDKNFCRRFEFRNQHFDGIFGYRKLRYKLNFISLSIKDDSQNKERENSGSSLLIVAEFQSIVMRKLLEYVQSEDGIYYEGLTWASLLPLAEFGRTLFYTLGWALSYRTALRIRSACSMLLYKKIVRLNNSGDKTIGKVNLSD